MKINYTNYLERTKTRETDPEKMKAMKSRLSEGLRERNICGIITTRCYTDGTVLVKVDGEYYNCFNSNTGKWFSGHVGDYDREPSAAEGITLNQYIAELIQLAKVYGEYEILETGRKTENAARMMTPFTIKIGSAVSNMDLFIPSHRADLCGVARLV